MSHILLRDVVDQTVINTAAEVAVFNQTIPAGLWPGNVLLAEQTARYNNGNASARTFTCRLRLNGNLIVAFVTPSTTANTNYFGVMQRWALAAVATNQVRAVVRYAGGGPASDTGNFATTEIPGGGTTGRYGDVNMFASDSKYVDLGKPVQMEVTVQMSVAAATHEFTSMGVWVILLGDGLSASSRPDYARRAG